MATSKNRERRRSRRRKLTQLVYLEFGRENGGMIRDVSEGGMRFHLMNRVTVGEELRFGVTVDPARRIDGKARMIWTDATGKSGGLAIAEMSPESRATMFSWLADIDSPVQPAPASQAPKGHASHPRPSQAATSDPRPAAPIAPSMPAPPTPAAPVTAPPPVAQQTPASQPPVAQQPPVPQQAQSVQPSVAVASQQPAAVEPPASVGGPVPETARPAQTVPPVSAPANPPADMPASASTPPPPPPVVPPSPPPPVAQQPAPPPPEISTSLFYGIDTDLTRDPGPAPPSLVSHDDWKRAAREMDVQERRSHSPRTATLEEKPVPPPRKESRKYSELADHVDPMREFLKSPPGAIPEPHARPNPAPHPASYSALHPAPHSAFDPPFEQRELPLPVQTNHPRAVSKSRVGAVFLLAIVCGLAVAYAGILYRQPLGHLVISLGQMIVGEQSSALPSEDPAPGATQNPYAAPDARSADRSGTPAVSGSTGIVPPQTSAPAQPSGVPVIPPDGRPSAPNATEPLAQAPTPNQSSSQQPLAQQSITQPPATPRPELTAGGKEIVPGKPRRLPEDVASLWQAVENGDTAAEVTLANHYAIGAGVERNCAQARVLLEAAAKHGNEAAVKRLIQLRSSGCQ